MTPSAQSGESARPSRAMALACALVTIVLWAGSFPAITIALKGYAPLPLAALRFLIAAVLLVVLVGLARGRPRLPNRRDLAHFALCALLAVSAYNYLLNTGQQTVNPGAAAFLIACQPVFTAVVATVVFKEAFPLHAWLGTAVCLIGAGIVAVGQPGGLQFGAGAPLILLAAASAGVSFALQRPLIIRHGALVSAQWLLILGAVMLAPWLPQGLSQLTDAPLEATLSVVFLGVLPGAAAYVTWMIALEVLGAPRAANLLFFMAPMAALMSIPLVGAWPGWTTLLGGAAAIVGVFIVHRSRGERRRH